LRQFSVSRSFSAVEMGDVIFLEERRADRSRSRGATELAFFFDLSCPFSYLAAERVERLLGEVDWIPVAGIWSPASADLDELCARAERRASELRLPLVWPDRFPSAVPSALRASVRAADSGSGPRFALAAARLAFCGGFDLEDPEVLAEAAAAAGVMLADCLGAAGDAELDRELAASARALRAEGVTRLPVMRVGHRFYEGEERLAEVAASLRAPAVPKAFPRPARAARTARRAMVSVSAFGERPLAPAG
jgi:2-hydroxychromene-2-carboxylate isomerase